MSHLKRRHNSLSSEKLTKPTNQSSSIHFKNSQTPLRPFKKHQISNLNPIPSLKPILLNPQHSKSQQVSQFSTKPKKSQKKVLKKFSSPTNLLTTTSPTTLSHTQPYQKLPKFKSPIRSTDALKLYQKELTAYEQSEIVNYTNIYYIGQKIGKIEPSSNSNNFEFDDLNGYLKLVKGDHIGFRYEVLKVIGKGTFGQVFECFDYKYSEKVAVKVIRNKKRFFQQAGIEVSILTALREHDAKGTEPVIQLKNYFLFRMHICMSFELCHCSLYDLLQLNSFQGLSLPLIRRFALQMLNGLIYLSSINVAHCDLKPENILLKSAIKSDIKIIDFGSSTFINEKIHSYIQSRFYRAPEVVLGIPYTAAVDMWSLGCILAELYSGQPLFPSTNEHDLLVLIIGTFGYPSKNVLEKSAKYEKFFINDKLKKPFLECGTIVKPKSKNLKSTFQDNDFLEFLQNCLEIDPDLRISPKSALNSKFIQNRKNHSNLNN